MTGEAVGQQTEGFVRRRAVVPRDAHPRGRAPRIRAVTHEAAAAARMARTGGETCATPGTARNIGLAGERALVTQLHRPGDARRHPWRPHFSAPSPTMATAVLSRPARPRTIAVTRALASAPEQRGARRHPQTSIRARGYDVPNGQHDAKAGRYPPSVNRTHRHRASSSLNVVEHFRAVEDDVDAATPVDAQNAPTGVWKSRKEREIPTAPTSIIFIL